MRGDADTCRPSFSPGNLTGGNSDKNFIERALQTATRRISKDLEIAEDPRDPLELDKDTQGISGSPNIFDAIRRKIDDAAVFVADLTFVSNRPRGEPSPNPNVLLEYGYALKSLSSARIVGVMNSTHSKPSRESLPFDLASYRFPITYKLAEGASDDDRRTVREQLAAILEKAILDVLASQENRESLPKPEPPPPVKYREPQQGRARFWRKGEVVGYANNPLHAFQGRPDMPVEIADGPTIWLRIMPERPIARRFDINTLKNLIPPLAFASLYSSYSNSLQFRGADGVGLCTPLNPEPSPSMVYVFTDAEIWVLDTYPFQALPNVLSLEENECLTPFARLQNSSAKH